MGMKSIDFRSDTVTKPSPEMRKAMYEAEVGDDVYAEDPTINRLQEMSAELMGKEAALFVSSGSMGNLIPTYINCGKGGEFLIDSRGHMIHHELASASSLAGSLPVAIPTDKGILSAGAISENLRPDIYYMARSKMIVLENTHNAAGGTFYTLPILDEIRALASKHGLFVHMDGARLFNASIASGISARDIAARTDTITFCLSKGLGAPVGAMLCGTRAFIAEARRVRKMLGGGMRQAGILAAAGIYALTHNVERLAEDHENAKVLARALCGSSWAKLNPDDVVTNILYVDTKKGAADMVVAALEKKGVLSGSASDSSIRFVTHLDVSRKDVEEASRIAAALKI